MLSWCPQLCWGGRCPGGGGHNILLLATHVSHCSLQHYLQQLEHERCPLTGEWIKKLWYIHTMEYYSAIKRNSFESVLMRWMNLEPIIQSEVSQKEKDKYLILIRIYEI